MTKINICKVKRSFRSWWLYETGRVTEVACWAHVRRPFYDIGVAGDSPIAREALERIQLLFGIEGEIRGQAAEVNPPGGFKSRRP